MNDSVRILVVEDNAVSRKLLRVTLETEGYAVVATADAQNAIAALTRERFDMVLQDLVLPDMHGFELIRKLRELPNGADLPVIAVSGFLSRIEEAQASAVGFTSLLVKPVEPSRLVDAVRQFLPGSQPRNVVKGGGRLVLAVNDDPVMLKLTCLRLAMQDFRVLQAVDGVQALAIARDRQPDIIFSDVLMPNMDGFKLCLAVRGDPALCRIPLVLVSAHYSSTTDHELARRVGANALLQGTPEFADVPQVLEQALLQGAPPVPDNAEGELELDHAAALSRQMEKQLMTMGGLAQRCTLLGAEVSLLGGVTAALARQRDPDEALRSVLAATLDAAGISKGALYLRAADRALQLNHAIGFDGTEQVRLDQWLAQQSSFVDRFPGEGVALTLASTELASSSRTLLKAIGVEAMQLIPLVSRSGDMGLLVLGAQRTDIGSHNAVAFGRAFAGQIVLALELTQAFANTADAEHRFREIAENIREVFFLTDIDNSKVLYVSPAYEQIWCRSCASLYANPASWTEAIHPDDRERVLTTDQPGPRESGFDLEYRIVQPDGAIRWIHARGWPVRNESGTSYRIAATAEDITERKQQQDKVVRLNRIRALIGGISSAILRTRDSDELLAEACRVAGTEGLFPMVWAVAVDAGSKAMRTVASFGSDEQSADFLRLVLKTLPNEVLPASQAVHGARTVVFDDLCAYPAAAPIRAELQRRGFLSGASLPLSVAGRVVAALVIAGPEPHFFDAEEMELLEWLANDLSFALEDIEKSRRLAHLVLFDALTGLPNEHLFRDRAEQFVQAARQQRSEVCFVVVDLEHFTAVNDSFGRHVGDALLREVGNRLQRQLVGPFALGRIAADTFAVAFPCSESSQALGLHETIFSAFTQPFAIGDDTISISAQAGIAFFPSDGDDGSGVFRGAEVTLKMARNSGQRYLYYSSEIHARIAQRRALEAQLRKAIDTQQFVLHYQARIEMLSGELVGAEALIRWQHPERGLVPPGEFIAFAEETGMIVPIGAWVIRQVCAQQAAWIAAGIAVVPVAVNVSASQFGTGDLAQIVRDALKARALDAKYLELELTESAVMSDPNAAKSILKELHKSGVNLALDDFGTGYSSLAHLKAFPFDVVKIDQSFVANIISNPEDAAIASAIIAMAHRLSLKVVAEGVETQGQFNYLRGLGCDGMQGFYFSPAVESGKFEEQLRGAKRVTLPPTPSGQRRTLLVVDDEPGMRAALTRTLRRDGYSILAASSGAEALDMLATNAVHVIISDQRMPGMCGTEFLNVVKQLYPDTMRIILSGYTDLEVVTDSVNRGAVFKFLTKPWDDELLREQVRDAFRRHAPQPVSG